MKTILLNTPEETENTAAKLALQIQAPCHIYLEGQLGAGKTTFVKGFLRGCGYTGLVKSPTYTLVETYVVNDVVILHADLYRIKDPFELEEMGFRDYFSANTIALIEWASHAADWLPKPQFSWALKIPSDGKGRILEMCE
ncbi:MAG: tRNA (adenosine(37)-N6)-threonylcarbamoyltransferase complex ATPase subunit type 1 TsaE [Gammaproteobacteria bacterium CG_4_10_14_0_8_um_filter_38_16]|nr:MAG: tRNA (adenosine(37)-N6)-threonylcarbamoyltransferase complex ATPase subunit type 1 TsaE [Gammaproteobacteria bacterium CG_4_10_14_0_8_um_filter_38_16]PJA03515.1 MAG: tRNA (adenosine(37)-N6)-threonylcarbamoyltransferase complex ATPase subunit type 1 TsaE [Gammaproteobacteria bacterium CG_4_10_14_0_2_um_filter_38_22]PJB11137.1 MAG: tRNA (adenosine(37)-N6)-threonylcarbamoyltransferase complex ATPase subunit type 1 TsaE [Gammaproteobacteria bacterium CG_4_9_14_3_um_filter_38_9]